MRIGIRLDNVLVGYDAGQVWNGAARGAEAIRALPHAEKLGLFLTPDKGTR